MQGELRLFPEAASSAARSVDALYLYLIGTSAVFALLIFALVIGFAVRYRRRAGGPAPEQLHGSVALELTWTLIPLALVASFFLWGAQVYFDGLRPPAGAMQLSVTAKQWMWKIQHPTGQREINELHVPLGVPIQLTMISEDVIHDFYVPAFRKKLDVLPGRYSSTVVRGHARGQLPPVLRRVLRDQALRDDRPGPRARARGLRALARGQRRQRDAGRGRRAPVRGPALRHLPQRELRAPAARTSAGASARSRSSRAARSRPSTRTTCASRCSTRGASSRAATSR